MKWKGFLRIWSLVHHYQKHYRHNSISKPYGLTHEFGLFTTSRVKTVCIYRLYIHSMFSTSLKKAVSLMCVYYKIRAVHIETGLPFSRWLKTKQKYWEKNKALVTWAHHYAHTLLVVWFFTSRTLTQVLLISFTHSTGTSGSLQNSWGLKVTKHKQEP